MSSEAIVLIERQIKAHREQAAKHEAMLARAEREVSDHKETVQVYYDCIAELEQAKHDIERATAKRTGQDTAPRENRPVF